MDRFIALLALVLIAWPASARELDRLLPALREGGHVIVFRHVATDNRQSDVYPFKFDDMTAQRQLSDKGRETAREIGTAMKRLGIPIGQIYTSRLNRAVETGKLLADSDLRSMDELTDSGAGSASAMAGSSGGRNAELGSVLLKLSTSAPKTGTNTILVTHKTNIVDGFGKDWGEVREGEATIFRPQPSAKFPLVGRVQASEWLEVR